MNQEIQNGDTIERDEEAQNIVGPLDCQEIKEATADQKVKPSEKSKIAKVLGICTIVGMELVNIQRFLIVPMISTYLINVWKMSLTSAAAVVNILEGSAKILPIALVYLSDHFMGIYPTHLMTVIAYAAGEGLLAMSTPHVLSKYTSTCTDDHQECIGKTQRILFFMSLVLLAVGMSGSVFLKTEREFGNLKIHKKVLNENMVLVLATIVGGIGGTVFSGLIKPWSLRFGIPAIICTTATCFLVASFIARRKGSHAKETYSREHLLNNVIRVLVAAALKRSCQLPDNPAELYHNFGLLNDILLEINEIEVQTADGLPVKILDHLYKKICEPNDHSLADRSEVEKARELTFKLDDLYQNFGSVNDILLQISKFDVQTPERLPINLIDHLYEKLFPLNSSAHISELEKVHEVTMNIAQRHEESGGPLNDFLFRKTSRLRLLDKSAIILPNENLEEQRNKWLLCTVEQVEETKAVIRAIPRLISFIFCGLVKSIGNTYFLEQANNMNRKLGSIKVPTLFLPMLYEYFRVGLHISRILEGDGPNKVIGGGLMCSVLCCIVAAAVERRRLHNVLRHGLLDKPEERIPLSVLLLVPQFFFLATVDTCFEKAAAEYFACEIPKPIRNRFIHLVHGVSGVGTIGAVLSVYLTGKISETRGKNWFQYTLNRSRLDRYYWTLSALGALNFVCFFYIYREK